MLRPSQTLEERHRIGFKVMLFLVIATGIFYTAKRKIWSRGGQA